MQDRHHWLWVFGDIAGLRWVLEHGVMAFADHTWPRARTMKLGDLVCVYVTRGAFHNPTRDRARVGGLAQVTSEPRKAEPLRIAGRSFGIFVEFQTITVLPERAGPEVAPLVADLERVKRSEVWGHYFRNSPARLSLHDYRIFEAAVQEWKARRP